MNMRNLVLRISRMMTGKKSIYCRMGKRNHFAEGTILYEQTRIGKYNYIAPYTIINNAVIGNYCSIGPGCRIGLAEHNITTISTRSIVANGEGGMKLFAIEHPTIVGNDVWIGANVIIKQGVKIGDGAVIGANSLVLKDVPAYTVAYGSPAINAKIRFDNKIIDIIERSRWFEYDLREARIKVKEIKETLGESVK